jgi:lipopolysaccharide export system protein LptA
MKSLIAMAAAAGAMALMASGPALAQPVNNSKAPIDVTADSVETHTSDCVAIYTGSAEALQDTARLRADTLIAHLEVKKGKPRTSPTGDAAGDCGAMTSLEAKGRVYYASPDGRRVHGDYGVYDAASKTITITGDVTAVQGENVMRGTKMVYNQETGEGHVEGAGKGPGAKNRPRGVFYPKDATDQGSGQSTQPAKPKKAAK